MNKMTFMTDPLHNLPRLFCSQPLMSGTNLALTDDQSHYLRNVLRKTIGDKVRLFNEHHGEWGAVISTESKKFIGLTIETHIRDAEASKTEIHLIFSPIKKDRNDMIIEKAVELGVTHLHPVLFARTIVREMKTERIEAQIIEAAEQCERLSLPKLSPLQDLKKLLSNWNKDIPIFAAIERTEATPLINAIRMIGNGRQLALLVGPEGGISPEEIAVLTSKEFIKPASLGKNILRAETAVFYGLSVLAAGIEDGIEPAKPV